jgi:hypothetical protein
VLLGVEDELPEGELLGVEDELLGDELHAAVPSAMVAATATPYAILRFIYTPVCPAGHAPACL